METSRRLALRIVEVYYDLASLDRWRVHQESDKEYHALAQSELESSDECYVLRIEPQL